MCQVSCKSFVVVYEQKCAVRVSFILVTGSQIWTCNPNISSLRYLSLCIGRIVEESLVCFARKFSLVSCMFWYYCVMICCVSHGVFKLLRPGTMMTIEELTIENRLSLLNGRERCMYWTSIWLKQVDYPKHPERKWWYKGPYSCKRAYIQCMQRTTADVRMELRI